MPGTESDRIQFEITSEGIDQLITKLKQLSETIQSLNKGGAGGGAGGGGGTPATPPGFGYNPSAKRFTNESTGAFASQGQVRAAAAQQLEGALQEATKAATGFMQGFARAQRQTPASDVVAQRALSDLGESIADFNDTVQQSRAALQGQPVGTSASAGGGLRGSLPAGKTLEEDAVTKSFNQALTRFDERRKATEDTIVKQSAQQKRKDNEELSKTVGKAITDSEKARDQETVERGKQLVATVNEVDKRLQSQQEAQVKYARDQEYASKRVEANRVAADKIQAAQQQQVLKEEAAANKQFIQANQEIMSGFKALAAPTPGSQLANAYFAQFGRNVPSEEVYASGFGAQPGHGRPFDEPTSPLARRAQEETNRRFLQYQGRGLDYGQAASEAAMAEEGSRAGQITGPLPGTRPYTLGPQINWGNLGQGLTALGQIGGSLAIYYSSIQSLTEGLRRYGPPQFSVGPFTVDNPSGEGTMIRNAREQGSIENRQRALRQREVFGTPDGFIGQIQQEAIDLRRTEEQLIKTHKYETIQLGQNLEDLNKQWWRSYQQTQVDRKNLDRQYAHENQQQANQQHDNDLQFSREQVASARQRQQLQLSVDRSQEDFARSNKNLYIDASIKARDFQRANQDLADSMAITTRGFIRQREELSISYGLSQRSAARSVSDEAVSFARSQADAQRTAARETQDYTIQLARTVRDIQMQQRINAAEQAQRLRELGMQREANSVNQFLSIGGLLSAAQSGDPFSIVGALFRMRQLGQERSLINEQIGRGGLTAPEALQRQAQAVQNQESVGDIQRQHSRNVEDISLSQSRADDDHAKNLQRQTQDQQALDDAHIRSLRIISEDQATADVQNAKATKRLGEDIATAVDAFGRSLTELTVQYDRAIQDATFSAQGLRIAQDNARQDYETNVQRYAQLKSYQDQQYNASVNALTTQLSNARTDYETALTRLGQQHQRITDQFEIDIKGLEIREQLHQQTRLTQLEQLNLAEIQDIRQQIARVDTLETRWRAVANDALFGIGLNSIFLGQIIGAVGQIGRLLGIGGAVTAGGTAIAVGAGALGRFAAGGNGLPQLTAAQIAQRTGGVVQSAETGVADAAGSIVGLLPLKAIMEGVAQQLGIPALNLLGATPVEAAELPQSLTQLGTVNPQDTTQPTTATDARVPSGYRRMASGVILPPEQEDPVAALVRQNEEIQKQWDEDAKSQHAALDAQLAKDETDSKARIDALNAAAVQAKADSDHLDAQIAQSKEQERIIELGNAIVKQQADVSAARIDELNKEITAVGWIQQITAQWGALNAGEAGGNFGRTTPVTPPTGATPRLAGGGIIPYSTWMVDPQTKQTYAVAGESGPEYVVPDSRTGSLSSGGEFRGGSITPQGSPMAGPNGEPGVFITDFVDPMGRGTSGHWEPSGGAIAAQGASAGGGITIRQTGVPMGFHSNYRGENVTGPGGPNQTYTTQLGSGAGFQTASGDTSGIASAMGALTQQIASLQSSLSAQPQGISKAALNNHIVSTVSAWLDSGMVG